MAAVRMGSDPAWKTPRPQIQALSVYRQFHSEKIRNLVYATYRLDFELPGYEPLLDES